MVFLISMSRGVIEFFTQRRGNFDEKQIIPFGIPTRLPVGGVRIGQKCWEGSYLVHKVGQ